MTEGKIAKTTPMPTATKPIAEAWLTKGRGKKVIQAAEEEHHKEDWADAKYDADETLPMDYDGEDGFDKGIPLCTELPNPQSAPQSFVMADSDDDLADLTSIVAQAEGKTKASKAEIKAESEKVGNAYMHNQKPSKLCWPDKRKLCDNKASRCESKANK